MKRFPDSGRYDPDQIYQPEADTYLLVEVAQKEIRSADRVLEIGTGTGYIGSHLTGYASLIVTDINPHACLAAKEKGLEVIRTDMFDGICGHFDLVIFNPPYLPTQDDERIVDWLEYALDGGHAGRSTIIQFVTGVGRILAPGGRVLLLISSLTGVEEVIELFQGNSFSAGIIAKRKIFDEYLLILRCYRMTGDEDEALDRG
ncbi:MAG TPA: HemK2/MTQ2 family protein methyltransferase [Methanoregulaceae archaeon]|nr:HemK2/MTQ2 family protein methyltransferase [Methanoregulaceae archaeon]